MPEGGKPRGVTPCPRSGAVAESARLRQRRNGREDLPHVQGQGRRPGGATPRPRSGAEAGRTPCLKGGSQEELPNVRGQGQWPRVPGCNGAGTAEKSYPSPRLGVAAERSYPVFEVRGGGREELPRPQCLRPGATAGRNNPRPRSGGCISTGGPRGGIQL